MSLLDQPAIPIGFIETDNTANQKLILLHVNWYQAQPIACRGSSGLKG